LKHGSVGYVGGLEPLLVVVGTRNAHSNNVHDDHTENGNDQAGHHGGYLGYSEILQNYSSGTPDADSDAH
jgi:hypothetical protein